jgi:hypothetical protein
MNGLTRDREHAERMLARARRKAKQVARLVAKWESRVNEANRKQTLENQPSLWSDAGTEVSSDRMEACQ